MTRTLVVVVGLRAEARIAAGAGIRVIVGGGRSAGLAAALETALESVPRPAVLSFGVAGALSPALAVGEALVPDAIAAPDGTRFATDAAWTARLRAATGARAGVILGADAVVAEADAKARLRAQTGADAVDMESHVAAALSARRGAPFVALRVISDRAEATLPAAAIAGMRADGGVDVAGVLRRLMVSPLEVVALIRTGRDAGLAFRALARMRGRAEIGFAAERAILPDQDLPQPRNGDRCRTESD